MRTTRHPLLRLISIFIALVFSSVLTGCGSGGGGGGNSPVNPLQAEGSTIEGFVSLLANGASIRAGLSVPNSGDQPLIGASCDLFAFDATGQERKIAEAVTNEHGFYRFTDVVNPYGSRNLLIRARLQNRLLEGVLPLMREGAILRAPTIDPASARDVAMIRHAARTGRQADLNLGELYALLPPKALAAIEERSSLDLILDGFLARQEARRRKLGPAAETLGAYAFELQQTLHEMIERGEVSSEDAWNWFDRKLSHKARELGIPDDKQVAIDTLDQALIFEPAAGILQGAPGIGSDLERLETERLRERKLRLLDTIASSMKVLVGSDPRFSSFSPLIDSFRARVERCSTVAELHRLFKDAGSDLVLFSDLLGRALAKARFTSAMIAEVFATPVPQVGLGFVTRAEGTTAKAPLAEPLEPSKQGSPVDIANALLIAEEGLVERLITSVKSVAGRVGLQLTAEEMKAIAWLILAQSPENLNYPPPPMTTPGDSGMVTPNFTLSGSLTPLATPKDLKGISFTHQLGGHSMVICREDGSTNPLAPDWRSPDGPLALLAAEGQIEVTKITAEGGKTLVKCTLQELGALENVEVSGRLVAREGSDSQVPIDIGQYQPMPMPQPEDPSTLPIKAPQPSPAPFEPVTNGGSSSSPGSTGVSPADPCLPVLPTTLYLVVERVVILPPSPPAPEAFSNLKGQVIQAEALGRRIPGLFILETTDPTSPCRGAILHSGWKDLDSNRFIRLNDWAGKYVTLSGTLIREVDQRKAFLVTEIVEQR